MKHLDLFSGIGGFALAADWVWGDVEHTFCDIDPFCQQVLSKHWPDSYIHHDIRTLTADSYLQRYLHGGTEKQPAEGRHEAQRESVSGAGASALPEIDILTGGFPCQPFSQAGRRRGTEDDRYLWPEMLRVIREFHPRWVVGENVGGLVTWDGGMVFEQVCADLEGAGYQVQAFVIPAVAVGAPHRRDRIWFVANSGSSRRNRREAPQGRDVLGDRNDGDGQEDSSKLAGPLTDAPLPTSTRLEGRGEEGVRHGRQPDRDECYEGADWSQNWAEVAAALCRVDDGLPRRLDRNNRLKALGNAIVPQVAQEIFKAIKQADS